MSSQYDATKDFLRGNPKLKAPDVKEYVPPSILIERMEEMKRIMDDPIYFAEKYFYINTLDHGKQLIKVYPKQAEMIQAMINDNRVICLSCRQSGKCVDGDTLITVRNKKTKKIEKLKISDFLERHKHDK